MPAPKIRFSQKYAGDNFKQANLMHEASYFGLKLKDKGIGYFESFSEKWNWHKTILLYS
ncbi:MAG: hypothetical protein U9R19_06975 [Bacteroidota bacterium]|nr:hypothetical protein [Bacteroidota bacterium]